MTILHNNIFKTSILAMACVLMQSSMANEIHDLPMIFESDDFSFGIATTPEEIENVYEVMFYETYNGDSPEDTDRREKHLAVVRELGSFTAHHNVVFGKDTNKAVDILTRHGLEVFIYDDQAEPGSEQAAPTEKGLFCRWFGWGC